jgi:signal transduction histidine kinase
LRSGNIDTETLTAGIHREEEVTKMTTFDGQKMDLLLTMAWLNTAGEQGDVAAAEATLDPTPREQEALRRLRAVLARAAKISRLGEMAGLICHEITEPLSAIQLNSQTTLRWLDSDEPSIARARVSIERIIHDSRRALDIVELFRSIAAHTAAGSSEEPG